jgi:hypothetical protein
MISGKSPEGLGPTAASEGVGTHRKSSGFSVRLRRGPVVAIVSAALLWLGLVAVWRLLR